MPNLYCCSAGLKVNVFDDLTGAAGTPALVTTSSGTLGIAVSPNGAFAAVGNPIQFITTATGSITGPVTTGLTGDTGLAWAPDSSKVYMQGTGQIRSCTPAGSQGTTWSVTSARGFARLAVSPDGTKLYAPCGDGLRVVNTTSGSTTAFWSGFSHAPLNCCISPDGLTLYVCDGNTLVTPVSTVSGTLGLATSIPSQANGLLLTPDGSTLYATSLGTNSVYVISTAGHGTSTPMAITHTTTGLTGAFELALSHDGSTLWVINNLNGHVTPMNTSTFALGTAVTCFGAQGFWISTYAGASGPPTVTATACTLALGPVAVAVGSGGSSGFPPVITSITITGSAVLNAGPLVVASTSSSGGVTTMTAVHIGPVLVAALGGRVGPGGFPVPGYRGRWRLTLHTRAFTPKTLAQTMIAELGDARGRQLTQAWNTPATLTFTLDGHSQSAALIQELLHDVVAWRWDDQTGVEQAVFRGPITQSQDQIDQQSHTVTFTCHDYTALLSRRILTATYSVTARDQDLIAGDLLGLANATTTSSGTSLSPASFLPVGLLAVNPAGSLRGLSGVTRNAAWYGNQNIGVAVDDLSKLGNGFDYAMYPSAVDDHDSLRVYYPRQGVTRADIALQYGSTVATLTRSVDSSIYANYVRVLGNNTSAAPTPQLYAELWDPTAASISTTPVGLWMSDVNAAADTTPGSLGDKAAGALALDSALIPAYTLGLTPGAYTWGNPNMGDTVPLVVNVGRLDVNTTVRVLGITYTIGDDGQEDVTVDVSKPQNTLGRLFAKADRDIKDLARR